MMRRVRAPGDRNDRSEGRTAEKQRYGGQMRAPSGGSSRRAVRPATDNPLHGSGPVTWWRLLNRASRCTQRSGPSVNCRLLAQRRAAPASVRLLHP
uniref:Uncharacterized protein n=1 Tax=Plectus sambesii TaxID=2011161 RepID=A0A914X3J9_9BILA